MNSSPTWCVAMLAAKDGLTSRSSSPCSVHPVWQHAGADPVFYTFTSQIIVTFFMAATVFVGMRLSAC